MQNAKAVASNYLPHRGRYRLVRADFDERANETSLKKVKATRPNHSLSFFHHTEVSIMPPPFRAWARPEQKAKAFARDRKKLYNRTTSLFGLIRRLLQRRRNVNGRTDGQSRRKEGKKESD